ncbi:extracellular solute-binding protein [Blastococcus sp. TF02A_35]|uniref:extracellular solute-binding protein n=1 Tax=Blastococcus sp. TF02A-35 TaxID=2559612 RepID=UPI001FD72E68|nr:extracellular solute-binding protein [Blastococcus sp. TF02A_35]
MTEVPGQHPPHRRATASRTGRARAPRRLAGAAAGVVLASSLAACGGGGTGGVPTLTWYTNPDSGGQAELAARCTEAAEGRYRISAAVLPRDAAGQREQLVRRLAANDASIDIMSLDPPFIPEFAAAGFLADIPDDVEERVTEGVVQGAIEGATWDDELVAVPFWANTQVLWYRKSVAEAAGLDMDEPVTWEQIVQAAEDQGKLVGAQGARAESLTVWLNALIESAGGSIIEENAEDPADIQLGLTTEAAQRAAEVMGMVASSDAVSPAFSTENEDASATGFEGERGGFQVNYPFVYPRALGAVDAGSLDPSVPEDYGAAVYPRVDPDQPAAPPLGGISLGISAFSQNVDLALEAAECITTAENQAYYFVTNGNPAAKAEVFDDPEVLEAFPQAPVIRESLELAKPRPQTPYYSEVSGGLQREYHPPSSVGEGTGKAAAELISAVLRGDQLL